MDDNELLELKFQKLHAKLIGQNLSTVVDWLFAANVISADSMEDLNQLSGGHGWSSDKSRHLMTLLHRSGHPRAFTELYQALCSLDSMKWIVERLQEIDVEAKLMEKVVNEEHCQCSNCGHSYQSASAAATAVNDCEKKEVNLLFLGETGVGKSTLINALANYLHFSTLDTAELCGGFFPVSNSFTVTDPVTYRPRTISTGPYDANEVYDGDGGSVTVCPTAYVLDIGTMRVNLIDTPGVRSTHGSSQDKINAHNVLTFVSAYKKLDLMCIVLKSNETRLTENFENCLKEIFRNLHDSAYDNVVFCITFSRMSNYGPGDTYNVLGAFCARQPKLRDLELTRRTVFCFENEPVRYLAECVRNKEERSSVELSWRKSVETTQHLWQVAVQVKPHSVVDTVSLNNCRRAILALCQPLVQTAKCVSVNVQELKRTQERITYSQSTELSNGRVEVLMRHFRFVELPYSATVCTSTNCCTIHKGIIYERVCHERCRWTPTIRACRIFNAGGLCMHCGCSYRAHVWSTCVPQVLFQKVVLDVAEVKRRKDLSMDELTTMIDTCAKLTVFLRDNAFVETFGDVIADSLQLELDNLGSKAADKQTQIICEGLRSFRAIYQESVESVAVGDRRLSHTDIQNMIEELFSLQLNGRDLRQAVNIIQTSTDGAVKRRQKVFSIHSWMFKH